jgi:hypothetical protein
MTKISFLMKEADLNKFDKIIDELEPGSCVYLYYKKNTSSKTQVVAFNVDPLFNNAVDGLMYIQLLIFRKVQ